MYTESFHSSLKYENGYTEGKQGKRFDRCLSVLLKLSSVLAKKRLIKLEKGHNKKWKKGREAPMGHYPV